MILDRVDIGVEDDFFTTSTAAPCRPSRWSARIRETWGWTSGRGTSSRAHGRGAGRGGGRGQLVREFSGHPPAAGCRAVCPSAAGSWLDTSSARPSTASPRPRTAAPGRGTRRRALQASIRARGPARGRWRDRFPHQRTPQPIQVWWTARRAVAVTVQDLGGTGRRTARGCPNGGSDEHAAAPFEPWRADPFRCLLIGWTTQHVLVSPPTTSSATRAVSGLFIQEFVALYQAGGTRTPGRAPELPVQSPRFADLAAKGSGWRASGARPTGGALAANLAGAPPALALPAVGRPSPFGT